MRSWIYLASLLALGITGSVCAKESESMLEKAPVAGAELPRVYRSVFKIEAATQNPDYMTPWNSGSFSGGIGTGFLIGENQFLTNAHVVSNAQRLYLTMHGDPRKFRAKVKHIAHDCDLALLEVEDFSKFEKLPRFSIGKVPALESEVRVIGYPVGGDRLSVTRGVVSRIDFRPYSHSVVDSHLVVQIDAAINPGNSGGPVLQGDQVVGVAFQGLSNADNTGYMIPTPVIHRFLKDIQDGKYDQYVDHAVTEFPIFNPAMRRALKLPDNDMGILVAKVTAGGAAEGQLQAGDVILALDGHKVDSAGQVEIDGEKLNMNEIIERKFLGDSAEYTVLREGKEHKIKITLRPLESMRMIAVNYGQKPRYVHLAGLTFQPLTRNLFAAHRFEDFALRRLFQEFVTEGGSKYRDDIVVLTRVEADEVTTHLTPFVKRVVKQVNGEEIKSLTQLHGLLYPADGKRPEFYVIDFFGVDRPLVLPSADLEQINLRIQRNYQIPELFNLKD